LRQSIWREKYKESRETVTEVQRADLERSWGRAIAAFEAARSWQERLVGLEGLRESLGQPYRASPPPDAFLVRVVVTTFEGQVVDEGPPFWTNDPRLRGPQTIQLELPTMPKYRHNHAD
jgi:hypothetical protein